ncbi:PAS domain S-box protein [Calothrix sp. FACHB-1219]|uniref:PAS domain S-box protein n=1 Tax=unclassified Calothrix TaxID=2619626 RepID=UPI00168702D4|nr:MULTISPECIES: PAS domain S-box protein [unclassified Calothrix]MBD2206341.1 PAS domain S-box protein [Calothrix sp. FACHB-168]MBD2221123.1 PAS domain S-box protein [Calothrix sp. FACHB-1219]
MTLRFLLLADNLQDATVIQEMLVHSNLDYQLQQVGSYSDFETALFADEFDLILADYTLSPALEIAAKLRPDVPFIFISGSLGEELAIAALQQGATDYVLKQRLERLVPAVQRALKLGKERRDRQRAAQVKDEHEEDLRAIFHLTHVGIAQVDIISGRFLRLNAAYCQITGYSEAELLRMTVDDINHPEDRDRDRQRFMDFLSGAAPDYHSEKRYIRKDGTIVWVLATANVIRDTQGRGLRTVAVIYDITERKQIEAALRRSEERLRISQELSLDAFTILDAMRDETGAIIDFVWTYVNPKAAEILQHSVEYLLGNRLLEVLPGNRLNSELFNHYVRVVETGEPQDLELSYDADGICGWFRNMTVKLEDGVAIFFHEITERKQTEQALRDAEERLRVALQNKPITIFNQDRELKYTWIYNPVLHKLEEMLGKCDRDFLAPKEAEILTAIKQQVLETGIGARKEIQITKDGKNYYYDLTVEPLPQSENRLAGITCAAVDISELKQAEINLRKSEERLRLAIESAQIGTWDVNLLTGNAIWSELLFQMLGYEPIATGEATEAMWYSRIHPDDLERVLQEWQESQQEKRLYRTEYRLIRADNQQIAWMTALGSFSYDQNGKAVRSIGVLLEISDRKRRERNAEFLTEISRYLAKSGNIDDILANITNKITVYFDLSQLTCLEINETGDRGRAIYGEDTTKEYRLADDLSNSQIENLQSGEVVTNQVRSELISPFIRDKKLKFLLICQRHLNSCWRTDEIELIQELTGRIWHRIERAHTEENLRRSEEEFRTIANAAPALVWVCSPNGEILFFNDRWYEFTGQSQTQACGYGWTTAMHPEDAVRILSYWEQCQKTGETYEGEVRYRRYDGEYRWHAFRALPRRDANGQIEAWYGVSIDITARIAAEQERERLIARERHYINQLQGLNQAALAINSALSVEELLQIINNQAAAIIGTHQSATTMIIGQYWEQSIHAMYLSDKYAAWRDYDEQPDGSGIYAYVCRINRPMRLTQAELEAHPQWKAFGNQANNHPPLRGWLAVPLVGRDGQNIGLIQLSDKCEGEFTYNDEAILVQLAQMAAIAVENARLYAAEQRARAAADASREEAQAANRIKDEFLAVLSHELRSPLNPILGWAKLLQTQKFTPEKTTQGLATIERNAKLQAQLIEDLLDVSRILRGKLVLNISPIQLGSTIDAAIETVRLAATAKEIQIYTQLDNYVGTVSGDSARIQQIIWNLLTNAVKFTPPKGKVEVSLQQIDNFAQIQVKDNGKGISPEFLPDVFDYFRQEDGATTRKFGGLGLGLAIVRHLVELHGGTVEADSAGENLGATFTVRLPLMSSQSTVNIHPRLLEIAIDLSKVQVLVVDDDTDSRDFVATLLQQAGATVYTAASAVEALTALRRSLPDILISDIGMPQIDGYMLAQQIRALPPEQGGNIPAIALTAYAGEIDQKQAIAAGFQRHIPKPIEPQLLLKAIAQLIPKLPS